MYLKKVQASDVDLLYKWANDTDVRKNAFNTAHIPYGDHIKWFNKMIDDDKIYQYILYENNNEPVGQIRLNIENDNAFIDYSISAPNRGKGYGKEIIMLMEKQVEADKIPHDVTLIGQVKYENYASAKVFEACGYDKCPKEDYIQYTKKP